MLFWSKCCAFDCLYYAEVMGGAHQFSAETVSAIIPTTNSMCTTFLFQKIIPAHPELPALLSGGACLLLAEGVRNLGFEFDGKARMDTHHTSFVCKSWRSSARLLVVMYILLSWTHHGVQ